MLNIIHFSTTGPGGNVLEIHLEGCPAATRAMKSREGFINATVDNLEAAEREIKSWYGGDVDDHDLESLAKVHTCAKKG